MLFKEFSHFRQNSCATKCPDLRNRGGQIAIWAMPKYTRFFWGWGFPNDDHGDYYDYDDDDGNHQDDDDHHDDNYDNGT